MSIARLGYLLIAAFVIGVATSSSAAEINTVKFARQYGVAYLPLMVLEHEKLVEKHAELNGLGNLRVEFAQLGGTSAMYDALLSDSLHFGAAAAPGIAVLWDKTRGTPREIRGFASISSIPMILNCRDPKVLGLRDITSEHKIAMNAVKVSVYATVLQIAVAKEFGIKNYAKLDPRTVALPHPDGMSALLSGGDITCHFTAPPYSFRELEDPRVHTILRANDVLGGALVSSVMLMTSSKFRSENPRTYAAVWAAYQEAMNIIHNDPDRAVTAYMDMTKSKETREEVLSLITHPEIEFTATPKGTKAYLDFMYEIGTIKTQAATWRDLFFDEIRELPGS